MDATKYIGGLFLKVADIKANGPVRVKIADVCQGKFDKLDIMFDDGMGCNATNGRALARVFGFETDDWVDQEVELVVGEIQYQGKPREAVLIKPISPPLENKVPPKRGDDPPDDPIPFQ